MEGTAGQRFLRDERGSATIETLIWFPLFVYLLVLITDVSLIYYGKAQALRALQDANRGLSVRQFPTAEEAQAYAESRVHEFSPSATVEVTTSEIDGMIVSRATLLASELMAVGSIPTFAATTVNVSTQHFLER